MKPDQKKAWRDLLEKARTSTGDDQSIKTALVAMDLPMSYASALYQALLEERWRGPTITNPLGYLKRASLRIALKADTADKYGSRREIVIDQPSSGTIEDAMEGLAYQGETAEPMRGCDGVWRPGVAPPSYEESRRPNTRARILGRIAADLKSKVEPKPSLVKAVAVLNKMDTENHYELPDQVAIDWKTVWRSWRNWTSGKP
jgi:hypothetical protein